MVQTLQIMDRRNQVKTKSTTKVKAKTNNFKPSVKKIKELNKWEKSSNIKYHKKKISQRNARLFNFTMIALQIPCI
jgi:hypothetical protein